MKSRFSFHPERFQLSLNRLLMYLNIFYHCFLFVNDIFLKFFLHFALTCSNISFKFFFCIFLRSVFLVGKVYICSLPFNLVFISSNWVSKAYRSYFISLLPMPLIREGINSSITLLAPRLTRISIFL